MANIPRSPFYVPQAWEPAWGVYSSHSRIHLLLDPPGEPVASLDVSSMLPWEATEWLRFPYRNLTLEGFGANPFFSKAWHYDFNEASLWTWESPPSAVLIPLLTNAGLAKTRRQPRFDYNDASGWTWDPGGSASLIPLLTNVKMYGAGGQAPTKQWHYDYNDYSNWPGQAKGRNVSLLITLVPFSKQWRYDYNDQSLWSWEAPPSSLLVPILTAGGQPPTPRWHYDFDESSRWLFSPSGFGNSIRGSFANPFFSKAWHYDFNEASLWTWEAPPSTLLVPILTAGGQPQVLHWHYDFNDASFWTWQYPRDLSLLAAPFVSKAWHYDFNDYSQWTWQYPHDLPLSAPGAPFVTQGWHADYNDASQWTWPPRASSLLAPILTSGGQPPTKTWRYDYDVAESFWQRFAYRDQLAYTFFGNPFVSLGWHYDYNDSAFWTWPPPYAAPLYLPVTAVTELHYVGFHANVGQLMNRM